MAPEKRAGRRNKQTWMSVERSRNSMRQACGPSDLKDSEKRRRKKRPPKQSTCGGANLYKWLGTTHKDVHSTSLWWCGGARARLFFTVVFEMGRRGGRTKARSAYGDRQKMIVSSVQGVGRAKKAPKLEIASPFVRGLSPTPLLSTVQCCLTSVSGQEQVWPAWYERDRKTLNFGRLKWGATWYSRE